MHGRVCVCVYLSEGIRHPHGPMQVVYELWQKKALSTIDQA